MFPRTKRCVILNLSLTEGQIKVSSEIYSTLTWYPVTDNKLLTVLITLPSAKVQILIIWQIIQNKPGFVVPFFVKSFIIKIDWSYAHWMET